MLGDDGQFGHVGLAAARVAGDEVGDDLLVEVFFAVDAVEEALECVELLERRLAHESQHMVGGMLWCHLQATADVSGDEFARVGLGSLVGVFVLAAMEQQVVAYATAYEAFLDAGQCIDGPVDVKQARMVGVQVRAYLRVDAAGSAAFLAGAQVTAVHAVHIG